MLAAGTMLLIIIVSFQIYKMISYSQLNEMEYEISGFKKGETKYALLYPGNFIDPLDWNNPRITDIKGSNLDPTNQFSIVNQGIVSQQAPPRTINIPIIGLSSNIKTLSIQNYGDAKGWETPKNVVGHIPTTANPGEQGIGYLFGHLNSPIKGEGSVFRNLTKIPDVLRQGKEVYVYVEDESEKTYLYKVNKTRVIPQEEFKIQESTRSLIELVACVPSYIYDHRLIVTAELVGVN